MTVTSSAEPVQVRERAGDAAGETGRGPAIGRWWLVALLVVGYAAHVAWRLWLSRSVPTPVAHADEDRYLLAARALAGGPGGLANDTAAFRALGYPLLLSPIYRFTSDPFEVYHAAQAIGALLNALTFPLAYLFGRRVLGAGRWLAVGLAFAVATVPAIAYYSEFVLTDAVFAPLGLGWLLLLHAWLAGRTPRGRVLAAVGAGLVVGYAGVIHVRGMVMLGVHAVVLALLVVTRRSRWVLPVVSVLTATAVSRIEWLAERAVADRLAHGGIEPDNIMLSRLTGARGIVHVVCDAAGQIWYAGVGTWGLAAVGLVVAVQRLRGRDAGRGDLAQRVVLATALGATLLIALSSAAALPPDGRASNHAYPRYIAFLLPVWMLVAVIALIGASRRRALRLAGTAAAVMAGGAFLALARMTEFYDQWYHPFDTPEASFLSNTWDLLAVARVTVTAFVLLAAFTLTVTARRPTVPASVVPASIVPVAAALAGLLLLHVAAMEVINAKAVRPMSAQEYATAPLLVHDLRLGPGDVVASAVRVPVVAKLSHQREVYWAAIVEFDDLTGDPPAAATVVVAPWRTNKVEGGDFDGESRGWRRIAGDPEKEWAVWLRDSDPRLAGGFSTGKGR